MRAVFDKAGLLGPEADSVTARSAKPDESSKLTKIDFYFWAGCPSHPEALELLQAVLAERGLDAPVELHEVFTHEQARELAFPGSPTIRVDGRDVDPDGAEAPPSLTCRVYRLPDGRPSPVPSREQLEEALT
jgi:hypothetical protein